MSCNGCRVLRKGCSDNCMLRHCLQGIDSPQAQAHATVFVAKFFGRAGLMSFISSVPEDQRPALFRSLLYEAVGRTVNPVNGVVGLLWTGNWHVCQSAVETVLRGGALGPLAESLADHHQSADDAYKAPDLRLAGRSGPAWPDLNLRLVTKRRAATPSEEETYSETTTLGSSSSADNLDFISSTSLGTSAEPIKTLRLFI